MIPFRCCLYYPIHKLFTRQLKQLQYNTYT